MKENPKSSTRRTFLRKISSTIAATTIGVAGWSNIPWRFNSRSDLTLFSEGQIGSITLKNRLIRAAASENAYSNGLPTSDYLKILESYASGGAGLILTGGMEVAPPGMGLVRANDDLYIPELEKIAAAVHAKDETCKIMAQLWHNENAGPSGIPWPDGGPISTLTVEQIEDRISRFSEAIRRVRDAGFDGTELNAHYTYFLSSFLSPITNQRTDDYGGSVENRVRIVKEIVVQAREKVGSEFPILIKVNCDDSFDPNVPSVDGTNIDNFHLLASQLENAGVDAIELSGNTLLRDSEYIETLEDESYFSEYSENLDVSIPVILTGGNRTLVLLEEIINRDKVDFFGMARPLVREPHLPNRWLEGGSVESECINCNGCFGATGPLHCVWTDGTEIHIPTELRVFPNPVHDIIYIQIPDSIIGTYEIVISDLSGKVVFNKSGTIKQVDISSFPKGTYLITVKSTDFDTSQRITKL
jgi:2,4-dienoyl-CoA reductase-like NADH-dependent reductase (Old Yellow Enzyme family)